MKVAIIGGGIVGLMAALRLNNKGLDVTIFEAKKCGSGASLKNQGMIHSGSMYTRYHPEIVSMCQEAQSLFEESFAHAKIDCKPNLYYGSRSDISSLTSSWENYMIPYTQVCASDVQDYFLHPKENVYVEVLNESLYSTDRIMGALVSDLLSRDVKIRVDSRIAQIDVKHGKVVGVLDANGQNFEADVVINASGLGTKKLLTSIKSSYVDYVLSRLSTCLVLNNVSLDRVIVSTAFRRCTIAPTADSKIIVIMYGAKQHWVDEGSPLAVVEQELDGTRKAYQEVFSGDIANNSYEENYWCVKTEFTKKEKVDKWMVDPGFSNLDHSIDGVSGLFTCIPGKYTLAFHATANLEALIFGSKNEQLPLPGMQVNSVETIDLIAKTPWS